MLEPSPPAVSAPPWFADDPAARGIRPGRPPDRLARADRRRPVGRAVLRRRHARRLVRRALARRLPPPRGAARRATPRPATRCTSSPSASSRRPAHAPTARSACATPAAASERRSSAMASRCASRAPSSCASARAAPASSARRSTSTRPSVAALADVYGFATNVLETLRAELPESAQAGRVQLWPEHFDVGLDLRRAATRRGDRRRGLAGRRAPCRAVRLRRGRGARRAASIRRCSPPPDQRAAALDFLRANV